MSADMTDELLRIEERMLVVSFNFVHDSDKEEEEDDIRKEVEEEVHVEEDVQDEAPIEKKVEEEVPVEEENKEEVQLEVQNDDIEIL
ncbi:uncharacterized protein A4U43_C06F7790 [Asparagus officinalis]|uniref:Uncharacterized protein n=1 Tax=Asparagus officinalis TaxID=4686 RepID=A0A5P1EPC9_ASPOF|nr:uncharacterized protein A4U43_C06F7790 [Asparagus officinalis]